MQICFILVETESAGNIGSAARALKNMGFSDLRLVRPPAGWRRKARRMAVSAADILEKARVFKSLEEALADTRWAYATTRRLGAWRGAQMPFEKAVKKILRDSRKNRTAIVFGKESKGLDNASLELCDWTLTLPAHPVYPSLNLAQAVMVTAFSLFSTSLPKTAAKDEKILVSKKEMGGISAGFVQALKDLGYERVGPRMMERIASTFRGILKRSQLQDYEARMFRGLFQRIRERASQK